MQEKYADLVTELLISHLPQNGASLALRIQEQDCNYTQLGNMVFSLRAQLESMGVKNGDRVLIQLPNSAEYVIAFLSILSLGAIAVPLDLQAGPQRLQFVIEETKPRLLILKEGVAKEFSQPVLTLLADFSREQLLINGRAIQIIQVEKDRLNIDENQAAAIIFSSGSTGHPKGVLLKHCHLVATARNLATLIKIKADHRELLLSPICHTDGWQRVAATLIAGGCVVFFDGPLTVPHFIEFVIQNQIDGFYSPPPFVRYILQSSPENTAKLASSCRTVEIGSAPVSPPELEKLMNIFPKAQIYVHFGLTESSRATAYSCRENPTKLHTVGKALPGVEILIVDKNNEEISNGQVGEIWLRGSQCTDSYWNRVDLTSSAFYKGWFKTGDYGSLDCDGFLTYQGRRDDMINFGGYHFFPNEVEIELGPVQELLSYLIVGKIDTEGFMGQIPIMFAVKKQDATWSAEKFYAFARLRLAPFKIPRKIIFVSEIIRTSSGKPDRQKMLETYLGT